MRYGWLLAAVVVMCSGGFAAEELGIIGTFKKGIKGPVAGWTLEPAEPAGENSITLRDNLVEIKNNSRMYTTSFFAGVRDDTVEVSARVKGKGNIYLGIGGYSAKGPVAADDSREKITIDSTEFITIKTKRTIRDKGDRIASSFRIFIGGGKGSDITVESISAVHEKAAEKE